MKTAFIFPGQGAQHVGMCADVCEAVESAAKLFDTAEQITGLELKKLCLEGPDEQLARTDIAQPAIFTVSAALMQSMSEKGLLPEFTHTAGLSLGEYTALYAAGAMDFETGLKLVAKRGELMQAAALARPSSMVAVIGLDEAKALELCNAAAEGQILSCANFNCPGQIVLSGETEPCQRAADQAESFGASAAKMLNVAGAFHSQIMAPAAEQFATVLEEVDFAQPKLTVLSNVDAQAYTSAAEIRTKLAAQLTSPVRWSQCVEELLAAGAESFYEIGPGKVLAGLMRRIDRSHRVTVVNSMKSLDKLAGAQG